MNEDNEQIDKLIKKTNVILKPEDRAKVGKQLLKVSYKLSYLFIFIEKVSYKF